jgi:hypothetical protein
MVGVDTTLVPAAAAVMENQSRRDLAAFALKENHVCRPHLPAISDATIPSSGPAALPDPAASRVDHIQLRTFRAVVAADEPSGAACLIATASIRHRSDPRFLAATAAA